MSPFETAARKAFNFLCEDHSFRCLVSSPTLVRFESSSVFFEAGYSSSRDQEIYSRIGRLNAQGVTEDRLSERLDFGLFLAVVNPEAYLKLQQAVPYLIATVDWQIDRVLSYFAAGLVHDGLPLLRGDETAYASARELRWWHKSDMSSDGQAQHE